MNGKSIAGIFFGILYMLSFFSPLACYHSLSEPYLSGVLWAFMTPLGYVSLALGVIIALYPKIRLAKHLSFANLLAISGILLVVVYLIQPVDFFLNLLYRAATEYDVDYYSPLVSLQFYLGILSILYKVFSEIAGGKR
jgi:hypothetical protein